ncbi:hypothetical protein QTA57_09455 [Fontisubflavum oceani]|uniref:hypothetical protein n=1 Tax=Fontisubflavum oceani TaxID=2978973 RepID=UPI0025B5EDF1|nr:hypothetical protein [Fontisubflavum oceani]WJY20133.1 hypothetical protein QTA57_09455 [Fontisubflavum oceani]
MPGEPLLDTILKTSAKVGDLYVPAGSLEAHLGRFASQLMVWTHDDVHKISIIGSAVGVLHQGRQLLICSRHQLRNQRLEDVGLMLPDGSSFVTSSGSRTFNEGEHLLQSDAYDVAAFEFTDPVREHPQLSNQFFEFSAIPPNTNNVNLLAFIVVGFPSADQKYELEDKNHLGITKRILVAEVDGQPRDEALLGLKFITPLEFDPDGLSGGPAYVVQYVDGEPRVFLGGILTRAGKDNCYILKSGFLWQFLSGFN